MFHVPLVAQTVHLSVYAVGLTVLLPVQSLAQTVHLRKMVRKGKKKVIKMTSTDTDNLIRNNS